MLLVTIAAVQSWRRSVMLRMRNCMRYTLLHAMDELSACRPERCWPASHRPAAMSCYLQRIVPLTPQTGSSYLPALRDATGL